MGGRAGSRVRLRDQIQRAWEFRTSKVGRATQEIEVPDDLQEALKGLGYTDG
jgi:hypothetical protein